MRMEKLKFIDKNVKLVIRGQGNVDLLKMLTTDQSVFCVVTK